MKFDFSEIRYNGRDVRKHINLPNYPTLELAEIVGIMLGDGNLYLSKKLKFYTTVCFNKKENAYLNHVRELFENYFYPYNFRVQEAENEFFLVNVSKCVGKVLTLIGIKEGNKVKNNANIPKWAFSNKKILQSMIRGLFDTDGSVYKKYGNYAQICFKFATYDLIQSSREALIKLDFNPTKIQTSNYSKGGPQWKFYLSRQDEVKRFFLEIEPANEKHVKRFKNIKNGGAEI